MFENPLEAVARLEKLAAWHRINAHHAGADWMWEARLRTAEDLEPQAAKIRAQLFTSHNRHPDDCPMFWMYRDLNTGGLRTPPQS
jgi:hypothetical protein